jgi:dipeptidyl aminopeptidase/acylaminoacyl peptidase
LGYDSQKYPEKSLRASPIHYVTDKYPPILLVHGTDDRVVPYRQSVKMYEKVNQAAGKGRAKINVMKGSGHGDEWIKADENLISDLYFADKVLWDGKNPYRTRTLPEIGIKE